jgi:hypothetical protein
MRKKRQAQIAMEYILIVTIALLIIIPGIYLFRTYAVQSSDMIVDTRLADISTQILEKAQKMYYYGPPSRTGVKVEMPSQINAMYILSVGRGNESYLVFNFLGSSGEKKLIYESEVPLDAENETKGIYSCPNISEECAQGFCKCFPERFFSKGIKNYIIEAKEGCTNQNICIMLDESS